MATNMATKLVGKMEVEEHSLRLAVLIDADNAQAKVAEGLFAEIARYGEAMVKRIYGDFTSPASASWKKILQQYAIKPVQQFAYTSGKNATDSTLIIDAMDLLYSGKFDGFCLVTSDSDFTSLATRLREEGLKVFGFGEEKTPDAFRKACHKFVFTEVLREDPPILIVSSEPSDTSAPKIEPVLNSASDKNVQKTEEELAQQKQAINEHVKLHNEANVAKVQAIKSPTKSVTAAKPAPEKPAAKPIAKPAPTKPVLPFPKAFMLEALKQSIDDEGWARLSNFGSYLAKRQPDFDSRLYGYARLSDLIKAKKEFFTTEERQVSGGTQKHLYLRAK